MNTTMLNQFENITILKAYANGRQTLQQVIDRLNNCIAGYLIGDKNKPEKLKNLIDCRDWLQETKPYPADVEEWLDFVKFNSLNN